MKKQLRQKCDCGLSFRYPGDFDEHKRVGCVVKSSTGPTFSDKDGDEVIEEVQPEPVEVKPQAEAKRSKKK